MDLILHILLLGAVIFFLAETLPGIYIEGYGTAIVVTCVYTFINLLLGTLLMLVTLPLMILTMGLFKLVINTFLLWLTDAMIDSFEIKDMGTTFLAAVLITIADTGLSLVF